MLGEKVGLGLRGHLRLELRDAVTDELLEARNNDNLIVTTGLNALAVALNWAFVQNYNAGWGSPFSSTSGNLGDVYGAVGTSNIAVAASQTALGNEVGRALLTTGTNTSNVLTYQFFFGTTAANGTIAEVGVFTSASSVLTTLTSGLTLNQTYTSLSVAALGAPIPSGATLTVNYGSSSSTQSVTTSGATLAGATTINVNSFIAGNSFAVGSTVAYNTGTLMDRALISPTVTKTAAQTATLNLSLTLQSG